MFRTPLGNVRPFERSNVRTFERFNVRTVERSNRFERSNARTFERSNVRTSGRPDVPTSRRPNVRMSERPELAKPGSTTEPEKKIGGKKLGAKHQFFRVRLGRAGVDDRTRKKIRENKFRREAPKTFCESVTAVRTFERSNGFGIWHCSDCCIV